ncbi:hypothetical protein [Sulfuracidifex tepidarius]|uniref:Uncharacterized protein n=1 Tax=Sulfuracidifex tepidarius TaxID=1294262 RepID=A0A510DZC7_9CREN|nr:hypothetical protein [Sulfuracidifex tepidarius]BBG25300.1 hypothetical protein IC006_2635 [Sulfuracidifex tepidarius]BBG28094.1 hypothetical protein IC007_2649 [Sulfuracidifex tepidarius]
MIICFHGSKYFLSQEGFFRTEDGDCDVLVVQSMEEAKRMLDKGALKKGEKIEICDNNEEVCMEEIRRKLFRITKSCKFS